MSVARFIADQRTMHRVPHAFTCRCLGVSESWFYKWHQRPPTDRQRRQGEVDAEVARRFADSDRTYGSPRIFTDLVEAGWKISEKTVAESMARQGLFGRKPKRRKGLTKQDKTAPVFPDLLNRDFTAAAPNLKWCGDVTEIPTDEGKLFMATVLDLFARKLLACPISDHPDTELCADAIKIAVAARGGRANVEGVIFHTDRGSTGGFNWSSQHLDLEVECDVETQGPDRGQAGGSAAAVGGGSGVACADAFAWAA